MTNLPTQLHLKSAFSLLMFMLIFHIDLNSQCQIKIDDKLDPSSCYANDGYIEISAQNGGCDRPIKVYKNNTLIRQGSGQLVVSGLGAGLYEIVSDPGCGCINSSATTVTLFAGNPTQLTPYVNIGDGFYQANKITVCKGDAIQLGVQSLGINGLTITGPNGFSSSTPDGSSYWSFEDIQPTASGLYTIEYTNEAGCISQTSIQLIVGNFSVNAGQDDAMCLNDNKTLNATAINPAECKTTCPSDLNSLLVVWSLDACDASTVTQSLSYAEFVPNYPSKGGCTDITASNVYRDRGDHSCIPVLSSYMGNIGMCVSSMESCDPADYDPANAVKFEVTMTPAEAGRITKLTFNTMSPINWLTTNGSTGPNNYSDKLLIRVYKNNLLIYSENDRLFERTWKLEEFDFSGLPEFAISEPATFRFEIRGYCVNQVGGTMSTWEIDDVKVYGGCCTGIATYNDVSYVWSDGSTGASIVVSPTETTTYTVTATDCNGCVSTDDVTITVYPLPVPIINGNTTICYGESSTLTASGGEEFLWSTGATTPSITVNPLEDQTYSVTVTDEHGCNNSTSVTVIVNPLPNPVIEGDLAICHGKSTTLTASGGTSFLWSTGATTAQITVSPTVNTTYSVEVTDANGCKNTTEAEVVVNPLPIPIISGINTICLNESTVLTASGGVAYDWSTGSSDAQITVSPSVNTTYYVTITDQNGCTAVGSQSVTVNSLPEPQIAGDNDICFGDLTTLTASGGIEYEWNTGENSTSILVQPGINTIFTVTVTDHNGCTASTSKTVSVKDLPTIVIDGDNGVCRGELLTLTANEGSHYSWSTGETTSSIQVNPSVTTIYSVTVTGDNGCSGIASKRVEVYENPQLSVSGDNELCAGDQTTLTAEVTGLTACSDDCKDNLMLRWSLDGCDAEGDHAGDYSEFQPEIVSTEGLKDITATEVFRNHEDHSCTPDDQGGTGMCMSTSRDCDPLKMDPEKLVRFSVTLDPIQKGRLTQLSFIEKSPENFLTTDGSTGVNNINDYYLIKVYKDGVLVYEKYNNETQRNWHEVSFNFTDLPEFTITSTSTFLFEMGGYCVTDRGGMDGWEIDDIKIYGGECPSSNTNDSISYLWSNGASAASINVVPASSEVYTVTATDCNGCQAVESIDITVHHTDTPVITGNNVICQGENSTLTVSEAATYLWNTGATTQTITISPDVSQTYSVTITDEHGCTAATSVDVTVNALPIADISGEKEICMGESTTLTASGGSTYAWSEGSTTTAITVTPRETTTYTVTVTDANGCEATTSATVTVHELPEPEVTGDTEICEGETTTLTATGGSTYAWSNGNTTSIATVNPHETTTYTLTVTSAYGCTSTTTVTVTVHHAEPASISGSALICAGSSTTLTASAGVGYQWDDGSTGQTLTVSPTTSTTYSVTVTDENGCTSKATFTVNVSGSISATISGDTEICPGESTTLTASGGSTYAWSEGSTTTAITVTPRETTTYTVTVTDANGCEATTSATVTVHDLPEPEVTGETEICEGECTTLTATGGDTYTWTSAGGHTYECTGPFFVGGVQNGGAQSLYNMTNTGLSLIGELGHNYINGIGYYCENKRPTIYGMEPKGISQTEVLRSNLVKINPETAEVEVLGEISQPNNPYGLIGVTGIMSQIGETTEEGHYLFPAVAVQINPQTLSITEYKLYLGDIDLNNHGNGSAVNYEEIQVAPGCKPIIDASIAAFQAYALDPTAQEPSGGIQDWAISPDGSTLYSFFGIENALFTLDVNTMEAQCKAAPASNAPYVGQVGGQSDEIGGLYFKGNTLYGYQVDRGRLFTISLDGTLNLVSDDLPKDYRGDNAVCYDCGSNGTDNEEYEGEEITVCPEETTTYTLTVTSEYGCTATTTVTVTVHHAEPASISGSALICAGSSTTLTASAGVGYQWDDGSTGQTLTVSPTTSTTYSVTVTDENGCTSKAMFTVNVSGSISATISGDTEICPGESTTLTASGGSTYAWSEGSTTTAITVTPRETTTYTVTVTDANGCEATTSATVTVHELPEPEVTGDTEICEGETTTLTATGGSTYAWSNGNTTSIATVNPHETTTYTLTVTSAYGCTSTTTVTVTVHHAEPASISGSALICAGSSTTLTASAGVGYQWDDGSTGQTLTVSPTTSTTYSVTVTDENGCTSKATFTVNVSGSISATISGDTEICPGESTTLTASGGSTYAWSEGSTTTAITVTPRETTTYTVTVTDANGCEATTSATVTVHDLPEPEVTGETEICEGECTTLTATGGDTYTWTSAGGHTYECTGPFFVGGVQNGGAQSLYNMTNTGLSLIGELGHNYINGIGYYCENKRPTIYGMEPKGISQTEVLRSNLVKINPETAEVEVLGEISQPNNPYGLIGVTGIMSQIGETTEEGHYLFPAVAVQINPQTLSITEYKLYLGDIDLNNHGNGSAVNYEEIQVAPGCKPIIDASIAAFQAYALDPTAQEPSGGIQDWAISPDGSTLYSFFGIENALFTLDVNTMEAQCKAAPASNAPYVGQVGGQSDEIGGLYFKGNTLYGYQVDRGRLFTISLDGTLNLVSDDLPKDYRGDNAVCYDCGSNGTDHEGEEITVCPEETTTYTLTVTSAYGCTATTTVTVTVHHAEPASISGSALICAGSSTTLTASAGVGYQWDDGSTGQTLTVSPTTSTTYSVTVTDENGCTSKAMFTVNVSGSISATISGDTEICPGESTTLTASGGSTYAWSEGSTTTAITVTPRETTTYTVTVTDANGCEATTSATVTVHDLPEPEVTGETEICEGETTTLTATGGNTYAWSNGNTTSVAIVNPHETTTYTVTVTNAYGCTATTTVTVTVYDSLTVTIDGDHLICKGDSATLIASGGVNYIWSNGETGVSTTVSPATTTTYTVTATNSLGCEGVASWTVEVIPAPEVYISGPNKICAGMTSFLLVNTDIEGPCDEVCDVDPQVLVSWDLDSCHSVMELGTHMDYSEFIPEINKANCASVSASNVYRDQPLKHSCTPGFDGSPALCIDPQTNCNPAKIDFDKAVKFQVTMNADATGQITGLKFYEQSPLNFDHINGPTGPNNYALKYLIRISKNGQVIYYEDEIPTNRSWGLKTFDFTNNPLFRTMGTATYFFEIAPYCPVNNGSSESVWDIDEIQVLGGCCSSLTPLTVQYEWSNGATTPYIEVSPTSSTVYTVTVTDCNGCATSTEYPVSVSKMSVDLGGDKIINLGDSITLVPNVIGQGICDEDNPIANELKYLWITGEVTPTITVRPNTSTFYRVTVTDCFECTASRNIVVHVRMFRPINTYPNPASDVVHVVADSEMEPITSVRLLSINGNVVFGDVMNIIRHNEKYFTIEIPDNIANGIYILEFKHGDKIERQKLIISQ